MLESLKERFDEQKPHYRLIEKEVKWLIEQAEKAERYSVADDYDLDMIIELQNKVERYEEALKEIAKYEDDDDVRRFALFAQRALNQPKGSEQN